MGSGGQKNFFGSKCLKLPNSSRKVVKLRSKNFQCIYIINASEISKILDSKIFIKISTLLVVGYKNYIFSIFKFERVGGERYAMRNFKMATYLPT